MNIRFCIRKLGLTASTNDEARQAAESGEPEGLVVWALQQTAGRGRHGRVWESPEGNLYCSILLRPKNDPQAAGYYGFVAALAIYDMVRELLPQASVTLKWPNDVLVNGKKISGILLEAGDGFLILGIGLNVQHHPAQTLYPSTSLSEEGAEVKPLPEILNSLLEQVSKWHNTLQKNGFAPIRTAWLERAQKGVLSVRLPKETLQGTFVGLGENGHLRLLLADGSERSISTGDVFFTAKEEGRNS